MKNVIFLILVILTNGCKSKQETLDTPNSRNNWWLWTANWHPNKDFIATGGTQDTLRLFSTKDYKLIQNFPMKGTITNTKWHPFKNILAISTQIGESKTAILDLNTNQFTFLDSLSKEGVRGIGWNNTGELLAVGDNEGYLSIFREKGDLLRKIPTGQKVITALDWHPENNNIIMVGEFIGIYDFEQNELKSVEDRKEGILMLSVNWHPSGDLFVTGDYGDHILNHTPLLQFWNPNGKKIKSVNTGKTEYRSIQWSPDGTLLATASDKIRLWNSKGILIQERNPENQLWGLDWNQDGTKLVTTDQLGIIQIWDIDLNLLNEIKY